MNEQYMIDIFASNNQCYHTDPPAIVPQPCQLEHIFQLFLVDLIFLNSSSFFSNSLDLRVLKDCAGDTKVHGSELVVEQITICRAEGTRDRRDRESK